MEGGAQAGLQHPALAGVSYDGLAGTFQQPLSNGTLSPWASAPQTGSAPSVSVWGGAPAAGGIDTPQRDGRRLLGPTVPRPGWQARCRPSGTEPSRPCPGPVAPSQLRLAQPPVPLMESSSSGPLAWAQEHCTRAVPAPVLLDPVCGWSRAGGAEQGRRNSTAGAAQRQAFACSL